MPLVDPVTMTGTSSTPARRRRGPPKTIEDDSSASASASSSAANIHPPTPLELVARHGSPAILLAALALGFDGLVSQETVTIETIEDSQVSFSDSGLYTLGVLLLLAIVVQVASAIVGLPVAGSDAESVRKRKLRKDHRKPKVIVTTVLSLILTALSIPAVHLVLVLFGAPFLAHVLRTLLCAAHLAVLGIFPVIYTRGTEGPAWRALASGSLAELDAAVGGLWGACIGAWLGAVPIPLDWDRPWQQWPVTVVAGMYLGHAVGRMLGGVLQRRA